MRHVTLVFLLIASLPASVTAQSDTSQPDNPNVPAVDPASVVPAPATDEAQELAKKLSNPIASLISLPLQSNYDWGSGPNDNGTQYKLNIQPVIPIALSKDWNVISRTIVPFVIQNKVLPTMPGGDNDHAGLGDVVQSLFFSPTKPTSGGLIWGAGPVFYVPTATDKLLGAEKWGAGPTLVALKQMSGWTGMEAQKRKTAVAWLSVASNSFLVLGTLVVGVLIGSVSVISEAIHSGVDLLAAVMLFAVKTSHKVADDEHPFGHGKVENISGTVEAILIFLAAGWIVYEAMHKLPRPEPIEGLGWGVAVMLVSSVVNIAVSEMLFKVGRETDSVALQADAWHLRTDVYTSAGVMVGLGMILVGQRGESGDQ